MKVVQLITQISGGAGIATLRLHKALNKQGVDSQILCLKGEEGNNKLGIVTFQLKMSFAHRILRAIERKIFQFRYSKEQKEIYALGKDLEIFSMPYSMYKLENHPLLRSADIIHLHWITGFVDYPSFFRNINKPMVWTFHDMNPFLGGGHYEGDLGRLADALKRKERQYQELKRKVWNSGRITPIYLCNWMQEKAQGHEFLVEGPVIPNCLDFEIFRSFPSGYGRTLFHIPENKVVFLFVAERVSNLRKGFLKLIRFLAAYNNEKAHFVACESCSAMFFLYCQPFHYNVYDDNCG